jgi:HEAT repeat protein
MQKIVEAMIAASEKRQWSSVIDSFQQLPLGHSGDISHSLSETEYQQVLTIALQGLIQGDFQQRWDLSKLFPRFGSDAIAPLTSLLEDKNIAVEIRWFAGRILSQFDHPDSILALVQLLQETEEEDLCEIAAQALAEIGSSAIASLSQLLDNRNSRLLIVQALAQIRRTEVIPPLLQVVNDPNAEIRATAIEALGSFQDDQLLPILLNALQDPAVKVRKEAVLALGMRSESKNAQDLVNHLKPLLYDLNPEVAQKAAIALGRIGNHEAILALFPLLKSPATPLWLKLEVVRAMSWNNSFQTLDYFQEGLRWSDPEVCQEITRVLGRKETPELKEKATQILINFLQSGQAAIQNTRSQQVLVMALGELGDPQAIDSLQALATHSEPTIR